MRISRSPLRIGAGFVALLACCPAHGLSAARRQTVESPNVTGQRLMRAALEVRSRALGTGDHSEVKRSSLWSALRSAVESLERVDLDALQGTARKTAFWINVYNGLVVEATVARGIRRSVTEVRDFFAAARYRIGGHSLSLEEIEHGILRANRRPAPGRPPVLKPADPRLALAVTEVDPRIHFALNCGARSCPMIRSYDHSELDQQLDTAARAFIGGPDVQVDRVRKSVALSEMFRWYQEDFGPDKRSVLAFVARYLRHGADRDFLEEAWDRIKIRYLTYDWSLPGAGT